MTAASQPLTVWPGHRGDGQTAYVIAVAADPGDVPDAQQASHDRVIEMTGDFRAGPVHWAFLPRANGLELLEALGMHFEPEAADFLHAHPESLIVVAMAKTDAPWRWSA